MPEAPARVAIVPARGGSKRFPRKNVAPFRGVPLVRRAVDLARASRLFDRVVVSTEDEEIAGLAGVAGADVHRRSAPLAADSARVADVCRAVLDDLAASGARPEVFCVLLPTAPFRTAVHLAESLALLDGQRANAVMSVTAFPHVPWWGVREVRGYLRLQFGRRALRSRDRLPTLYRHNGVVLWVRTAAFRRYRDFYMPRLVPYHMSPEDSVDIDERLDLEFAEFLAARRAG